MDLGGGEEERMQAQSQPVSWLGVDAWVQFRVCLCMLYTCEGVPVFVPVCLHVSFLGFR